MALIAILNGSAAPIGWSYENTATHSGAVAGIRTNDDGGRVQGNSDISFAVTTNIISDLEGRLGIFRGDATITITGTTLNNGTFTIVSVTNNEIEVAEALATEPDQSALIEGVPTEVYVECTQTNYSQTIPGGPADPGDTCEISKTYYDAQT